MHFADVDVVRALLLRVKAAMLAGPVTDQTLLEIEMAVRAEFGGEARYVGRQIPKAARDELMAADLAAGFKPREVARRHGVSVRTAERLRDDIYGRP